jgi:hypothetical protein
MYQIDLYLDATTNREVSGYDEVSDSVAPEEVFGAIKRLAAEGASNITLRVNVIIDRAILYNEDGNPVEVRIPITFVD